MTIEDKFVETMDPGTVRHRREMRVWTTLIITVGVVAVIVTATIVWASQFGPDNTYEIKRACIERDGTPLDTESGWTCLWGRTP